MTFFIFFLLDFLPDNSFFFFFVLFGQFCMVLGVDYRVVGLCCHCGTCMGGLDMCHESMLPYQGASFLAFLSCVRTIV